MIWVLYCMQIQIMSDMSNFCQIIRIMPKTDSIESWIWIHLSDIHIKNEYEYRYAYYRFQRIRIRIIRIFRHLNPSLPRTSARTPLSAWMLSSSPWVVRWWVHCAWAAGPLEARGKRGREMWSDCKRLPLGIDIEPDVCFDESGYRVERMPSLLDPTFSFFSKFLLICEFYKVSWSCS
jgi:hypothetical protein